MMVVRPVRGEDLDGVLSLAGKAGVGLTTLPNDRDRLRARIGASEAAFAAEVDTPGEQAYLFVLEDTGNGHIAGTCGVVAAVGLSDAFYNYRLGTTVYASRELGVYNPTDTLFLSNDLTGSSELGTLFLDPEYRRDGLGRLLSKSRFLFMRMHRARFNHRVIAELRGVADAQGYSPFWEHLGRKFFAMDFSTADALSATEMRSFIAELMPKQPLDTILLPEPARAVIGKVHENTRPARAMLEAEGFRFRGYVDIFDAGPALECELDAIRTVRKAQVLAAAEAGPGGRDLLVAAGELAAFRCIQTRAEPDGDELKLEPAAMASLLLSPGEAVVCAPHPGRSSSAVQSG